MVEFKSQPRIENSDCSSSTS